MKIKWASAALSIAGCVLCLISSHIKLCDTRGCNLASLHSVAVSGHNILYPLGAAVFATLSVLLLLENKRKSISQLISLILITGLSAEGFLTGYQIFRLKTICSLCFVILAIFSLISIIELIAGKREIVAGISSFTAVLLFFCLTAPVTKNICLPQKDYILFYSESCAHCEKALEECKKCGINVCPLPADKYIEFLKTAGINTVPALVINSSNEKRILVGENTIRQYLRELEVCRGIEHIFRKSPPAHDVCPLHGCSG